MVLCSNQGDSFARFTRDPLSVCVHLGVVALRLIADVARHPTLGIGGRVLTAHPVQWPQSVLSGPVSSWSIISSVLWTAGHALLLVTSARSLRTALVVVKPKVVYSRYYEDNELKFKPNVFLSTYLYYTYHSHHHHQSRFYFHSHY